MKITKIEIENINSLKGYWCIDLTHPDYKKNHDLFVICGETGSGKTTILDAITLALYGRTPRQSEFGKTNEVMTRHTAKCMAKVTYECKKGCFESEFSQQRARDNASGNLQQARGCIKNCTTGEIFPNLSIKNLNVKTVEIIQLDYDQFCRSILLAQGKFAEFIEGNPSTRAQILAKLNGTEKYKIFAQNIWARCNEKIKEVAEAQRQADEIELLSDEEFSALKDELEKSNKTTSEDNKRLETVTRLINWKEKLDNAKLNLENAKQSRKNYEEKEIAFEEDKFRLSKAEKAKNCEAFYSNILDIRQELEKDGIKKEKAEANLQLRSDDFSKKEFIYEECNKNYQELKEKRNENEKLWKEVREIDLKLENSREKLNENLKRKNDSEKIYNENFALTENLQSEIKNLENEITDLIQYLKENKKDENLLQILTLLGEKKLNLSRMISVNFSDNSLIQNKKEKLSQKENDLKTIENEKKSFEGKLNEIIRNEYLLVAKILRSDLKNEKECPVCGSKNHPFCENNNAENKNDSMTEKNTSETEDLTKNISLLTEKLEECENRFNEISSEIDGLTKEISALEEKISEENKEISNSLEEINTHISIWNFKITLENFDEDFSSVLEKLSVQKEIYEEKTNNLREKEKSESEKSLLKNQIDLKTLKNTFEKEKSIYLESKKEFDELSAIRITLFGGKNVETEEANFKNLINQKEIELNKADEEKNSAAIEKTNANKELDGILSNIKDRKEKLLCQEKEFIEILKKNDFSDEKVFVSCLLTEEELEELREKEKFLKEENIKTETQLSSFKNEFKKIEAENLTSESKEALVEEKIRLSDDILTKTKRIGELNNILSNNQDKIEQKKSKLEVLFKLEEEKNLWESVRAMIGNKDGSTFETFVEALEFKNLLVRANRYVSKISGKYTLVQKEGEVDFLIHDENYPDSKDDRPVSNLSGGEKFIISLSLALGIAELASSHVMIDSLFLDEGFGTLSGEPLTEAINALKSLQTSGKMLGIITHIDGVINEFDQKIKAIKKSGGISELEGSGISRIRKN